MKQYVYILISLFCIFISNTSSAYIRELPSEALNYQDIKNSIEKTIMSAKGHDKANNVFQRMKREIGNREVYLECLPSCEKNANVVNYNIEYRSQLAFLDEICRLTGLYWKIVPGKILVGTKNEILMAYPGFPEPNQNVRLNNPWTEISYSVLECPWGFEKTTQPVIHSKDNGRIGNKPELILSFHIGRRKKNTAIKEEITSRIIDTEKDSLWEGEYPQAGDISAGIHYENGTITDSLESQPCISYIFGRSSSQSGMVQCHFPWGANTMDNAWLLLSFLNKRYWLDIPFGFTMSCEENRFPSEKSNKDHKTLTDMEQFHSEDKLIRWESVSYRSIELEDGSLISLQIKNTTPPECEIILYSERLGNSGGWRLDSPKVSLEIQLPDGNIIRGGKKPTKRPDRYRRLDSFTLPVSKQGRFLCTITIKIDRQTFEYTVPSSLIQR